MATKGFQHRGSGYLRRQVCLRPIHVACYQKSTHKNTHKTNTNTHIKGKRKKREYSENSGITMSHFLNLFLIQRYLQVMMLCYSLTIILKSHVVCDNAKSPCWISFQKEINLVLHIHVNMFNPKLVLIRGNMIIIRLPFAFLNAQFITFTFYLKKSPFPLSVLGVQSHNVHRPWTVVCLDNKHRNVETVAQIKIQ